jgi:hypothetical protein
LSQVGIFERQRIMRQPRAAPCLRAQREIDDIVVAMRHQPVAPCDFE